MAPDFLCDRCGIAIETVRVWPVVCACGLARDVGGQTVRRFRRRWVGLGDVLAAVAKWLGFKECGKCRKRRRRLNNASHCFTRWIGSGTQP